MASGLRVRTGQSYLDVEYIRKGDESENAAAPEASRPDSIEERILKAVYQLIQPRRWRICGWSACK